MYVVSGGCQSDVVESLPPPWVAGVLETIAEPIARRARASGRCRKRTLLRAMSLRATCASDATAASNTGDRRLGALRDERGMDHGLSDVMVIRSASDHRAVIGGIAAACVLVLVGPPRVARSVAEEVIGVVTAEPQTCAIRAAEAADPTGRQTTSTRIRRPVMRVGHDVDIGRCTSRRKSRSREWHEERGRRPRRRRRPLRAR